MKNLAKYILPLALLVSSCSNLEKIPIPEITYSSKHPQEFWEENAGFEFKKGNFIYKISEEPNSLGNEILYMKDKDLFVKIVEENHYGNVDEINLEGTKSLFFFEGKNLQGKLSYKFVVPENQETSPEIAKELFLNYDAEFRKFKEKYSIEEKLKEINY